MRSSFWRLFIVIGVFVISLLSFASTSEAAGGCTQTSQCSDLCSGLPACTYSCQGVYTNNGTYHEGHCVSTQDDVPPSTNPVDYQCGSWGPWSDCNGGQKTRECNEQSHQEMQVQSCTVSPTGSNTPISSPSPSAGCVTANPTAVNLSSPANGASLSNPNVDLTWFSTTNWGSGCPDNKRYNVYVSAGVNPPTDLVATTSEGVITTQFVATPGVTYYWRVATLNGTGGTYSLVRSFTVQAALTGNVYIDTDNTCSTSTLSSFSGMTATVRGTAYSSAVSTGGSYSIPVPVGSYNNLDLSGIPAGYYCSTGCFQSCPTISTVSTATQNNYFISSLLSGWWQAEGASIYAGSSGGGLVARSQLPSASSKLILPSTGGTAGALIIGSGGYGTGQGTVSTSLWATVSKYKGKKMDYSYFAAKMGVLKAQVSDWAGSDQFSLAGYPTGKDFGYMKPSTSTASITTPITVGVGEKYVIFVNGNLRIENNITVSPGGFLALIVNGNLTVSPTVTSIAGIFISSGNFVTESTYVSGVTNDAQLQVSGNVISWGSLSLGRNLGPGNTTIPAEKFVYRTDFLSNMPEKMKTFAMEWQEVAPGTISN